MIADRGYVMLPEGRAEFGGKSVFCFAERVFEPDEVEIEVRMDGMKPDLVARKIRGVRKELLIEIRVTHACEPEKVALIRGREIPTMEIDLSKLPRDAPAAEQEEAILKSAGRQWIFNPIVERKVAELRQAAARKAEIEQQRLEAEQAVQIRKDTAPATKLVDEFRASQAGKRAPPDKELQAEVDNVSDAGLCKFVGIPIVGSACFTAVDRVWQSAVIELLVLQHSSYWKRPDLTFDELMKGLAERNLIVKSLPEKVSAEVITIAKTIDPDFRRPREVVWAYLKALHERGVVKYKDREWRADESIANAARSKLTAVIEDRKRTEKARLWKTDLNAALTRLKSGVPTSAHDRIRKWMWQPVPGFGLSPTQICDRGLRSDYTRLKLQLEALEGMLVTGAEPEDDLLGLPLEEVQQARRTEKQAAEEERQRVAEREAREAAEAAQRKEIGERDRAIGRMTALKAEVASTMPGEIGKAWLRNHFGRKGFAELPVLLDWHASEAAWSELSKEVGRLQRVRDNLSILASAVVGRRSAEWVALWAAEPNALLDRMLPVDLLHDQAGLRRCREALRKQR